jgi:hypothetical protein
MGLIGAIGLPLLMLVGGYYAWRMSKKQSHPEADKPGWVDDSLDDWRKTRDAELEEERLARVALAEKGVFEGSATNESTDTRRQQRIGG